MASQAPFVTFADGTIPEAPDYHPDDEQTEEALAAEKHARADAIAAEDHARAQRQAATKTAERHRPGECKFFVPLGAAADASKGVEPPRRGPVAASPFEALHAVRGDEQKQEPVGARRLGAGELAIARKGREMLEEVRREKRREKKKRGRRIAAIARRRQQAAEVAEWDERGIREGGKGYEDEGEDEDVESE